jgi:aminopeptidase N
MRPCLCLMLLLATPLSAQRVFTRADTLRGAFDTPGRAWWDVTFYDLHVRVSHADSTVRGHNAIGYRALADGREMQIDLMVPLIVDSMVQGGKHVPFRRDGNAFFATLPKVQRMGTTATITVYYHGTPQEAKRPPWEGGFTWTRDSLGRPWIVTTDQGMGASVWWPNKDTQADEPDSQRVAITIHKPLINVSNGRLRSTTHNSDSTTTYEWFVTNPINNYAIAVAAGNYAHWSEMHAGEKGPLTMDFWPLDYNLEAAKRQWVQARTTMQCFEHWFGPYPWYEDGYKLIEVPNSGMEHQSAVSYGNYFVNGYRRRDMAGNGLGLTFDFIIVHETAHEWWGNNITAKDNADMWIAESFANYAEALYVECQRGKEDGARYNIGSRRSIRNDRPIIPSYGVNDQGSGDMYPKGGAMLHTIRQLVDDDEKWRGILRGLNATFRHQTVMGKQVEEYLSRESGMDLTKVFDQYLRTTKIPELNHQIRGDKLQYRWTNVVPGFAMPVRVRFGTGEWRWLRPTTEWQTTAAPEGTAVVVDPNLYITAKEEPRNVMF